MAANKRGREDWDAEVTLLLVRLAVTVLGLILSVVLVRNWQEVKERYAELDQESPLLASLVKWAAIAIFVVTVSTISMIVVIIYKSARGEL